MPHLDISALDFLRSAFENRTKTVELKEKSLVKHTREKINFHTLQNTTNSCGYMPVSAVREGKCVLDL